MPEKEIQKDIPPPILLSAIICERVIIDSLTRMPSIIYVMQTVSAPKYPARHGLLNFFCELTNGHGNTQISVRMVDVQQEDNVLLEQVREVQFADVRQVAGVAFGFEGIVFPHPGEYRFQIYAGTEFLGERRIICREIKLPSGGMSNG